MFGLSFNPLTSKTVGAGFLAAVTVLYQTYSTTGHLTIVSIGAALSAFLGAIGVRDAIAKV